MRVEATNAIRYNGKVQKAGSVFEVDMKTGERLFRLGHVSPSAAPVREIAEAPAATERLLKELGTPSGMRGKGKGKVA